MGHNPLLNQREVEILHCIKLPIFALLFLIVLLTAGCTEQGLKVGSGDDVAVIDSISDEPSVEPAVNETSPQDAPPAESAPTDTPDQDTDKEPDQPDPNSQLVLRKETTRVGDDCRFAKLSEGSSDKAGRLEIWHTHCETATILFSKKYSRPPFCVASSTREFVLLSSDEEKIVFYTPNMVPLSYEHGIYYICELPEELPEE